ncbi:MAG: cytochrome c biogenesis protein CcsA [Kiloniellales bacterium]|nr:cytochrome c biogenesis protein CcsA [Kiloniellales bacterium]
MWHASAMSFAALVALLPGAILPFRRRVERPDMVYWLLLAVALAGSSAVAVAGFRGAWNTGFSATLWLSIATTLAFFILLSAALREAWRLAPLTLPYLLLLGLLATIWAQATPLARPEAAFDAWLRIHIATALATYALATLAAVAATAVLIQERALKRKRETGLSRLLPALADAERLEVSLLRWSVLVMAVGLMTGMAVQYLSTGLLLILDHKVLLSFLAFAVLLLLLAFHHTTGLRGRMAVRLALLAYLLLTLAFLGVKFVTDVLAA